MRIDGVGAKAELFGDLPTGQALGHQVDDFFFTACQLKRTLAIYCDGRGRLRINQPKERLLSAAVWQRVATESLKGNGWDARVL